LQRRIEGPCNVGTGVETTVTSIAVALSQLLRSDPQLPCLCLFERTNSVGALSIPQNAKASPGAVPALHPSMGSEPSCNTSPPALH
jgi:hypothetical protein